MKKMTKRLSLLMTFVLLLLTLTACGGGVRADEKYQGKYVVRIWKL